MSSGRLPTTGVGRQVLADEGEALGDKATRSAAGAFEHDAAAIGSPTGPGYPPPDELDAEFEKSLSNRPDNDTPT